MPVFFWLVCLLAFIYYHRYKFLASMSISQDFCKMSTFILIDFIHISLGGALLVSCSNIKMINVVRWNYDNTKTFLLFCYAIELVGTTEK